MLAATTTLLLNSLLALRALAAPISRPAEGFDPIKQLMAGNEAFRTSIETSNPGLLALLSENGQAPQSMMLACSDSRGAPEVFTSSVPGTMFTDRNIANQFPAHDASSPDHGAQTVMTYAVEELGTKHIIIMGHYGCGGVAAAIASPPTDPSEGQARVQEWIQPIREIWANSTVPEIVAARNAYGDRTNISPPDILDPAFRRLVEENVKAQVKHAAEDPIVQEQWEAYMSDPYFQTNPAGALWVHGMVYDIGTGVLTDLGISVGPGSEAGEGAPTTEEAPVVDASPSASALPSAAPSSPAISNGARIISMPLSDAASAPATSSSAA